MNFTSDHVVSILPRDFVVGSSQWIEDFAPENQEDEEFPLAFLVDKETPKKLRKFFEVVKTTL